MAEEPSKHPACAACRYQRKKCAADCILRRHFPADNTEGFAAVHRLFGVSNVTKMMREANSLAEQDEIAKSLYWEAAMWIQDPARGPYGAYQRLQDEIEAERMRRLSNKKKGVLVEIRDCEFDRGQLNGSDSLYLE